MSYGKRIYVGGKRPDWFRNKDAAKIMATTNWGVEQKDTDFNYNPDPDTWGWDSLKYIQLPADHEVYIALNAGLKPFRPEVDKFNPPSDYVGGKVITRKGSTFDSVNYSAPCWAAGYNGNQLDRADCDIVGYEPKKEVISTPIMSGFFVVPEGNSAGYGRPEIKQFPDIAHNQSQPVTDACDIHEMMLAHFALADEAYPDFKAGVNATPVMISLENVLNSLKQAGILVKPVDPDLVQARTIAADVANQGGNSRLAYEKGERDESFAVRTALAAIKATKN